MSCFRLVLVAAILAVMLLSGGALAQILPPLPPSSIQITVSGIISAIDYDKGAVTLSGPTATTDARPIVFFVTPKTAILKDGRTVPFSALVVGDDCKAAVVRASDGRLFALTVVARSARPTVKVFGKIDSIDPLKPVFALKLLATAPAGTPTSDGGIMTFSVDNTTTIVKNGKPCGFKDLRVGDLATVAFWPQMTMSIPVWPIHAVAIEAKTPPELIVHAVGRISQIDSTSKMIGVAVRMTSNTTVNLTTMWFQATNATKITKIGAATFGDLQKGDMVDVTFVKSMLTVIPPALTITVMPEMACGRVATVDTFNYTIGLQSSPTGPVKLFKVAKEAKIFKNGKPVSLGDIKQGDMANLQYFRCTDADVAVAIYARTPVAVPVTPTN